LERAAVINAIHNATGARIRDIPATPDKLLATLEMLDANDLAKITVAPPPLGFRIFLPWPHMALTAACRRAVTKSLFVHVEAGSSHYKARHFCCTDARSRWRLI
jgi:hypothetical protein